MSILCTDGELERFIVCYFWMVLVKIPNQQYFSEEELSYSGVFLFFSRNWFKTLIQTIHVVDNLSVDAEAQDGNNIWKIRPWLENLRQRIAESRRRLILQTKLSFYSMKEVTCVNIFQIIPINGGLKFEDILLLVDSFITLM